VKIRSMFSYICIGNIANCRLSFIKILVYSTGDNCPHRSVVVVRST
jgi:hypothetical protein